MVDGAASEWIKIVSGVPQGSVLCALLFILYTSEMVELLENRQFAKMLMTPYNWQLFASQQKHLLWLPSLIGTWLGFRSGAITGA